ncbi:uncharacterized protein LOC120888541 [Ictidomys tridecemlineatus]
MDNSKPYKPNSGSLRRRPVLLVNQVISEQFHALHNVGRDTKASHKPLLRPRFYTAAALISAGLFQRESPGQRPKHGLTGTRQRPSETSPPAGSRARRRAEPQARVGTAFSSRSPTPPPLAPAPRVPGRSLARPPLTAPQRGRRAAHTATRPASSSAPALTLGAVARRGLLRGIPNGGWTRGPEVPRARPGSAVRLPPPSSQCRGERQKVPLRRRVPASLDFSRCLLASGVRGVSSR